MEFQFDLSWSISMTELMIQENSVIIQNRRHVDKNVFWFKIASAIPNNVIYFLVVFQFASVRDIFSLLRLSFREPCTRYSVSIVGSSTSIVIVRWNL